jgi:hypothetical protein
MLMIISLIFLIICLGMYIASFLSIYSTDLQWYILTPRQAYNHHVMIKERDKRLRKWKE